MKSPENSIQDTSRRTSLRLPEWNYSAPGAYFVTICTKNREHILGEIKNEILQENEAAKICRACWLRIPQYVSCVLDEFIIMPNHIHGIIFITDEPVGAIHELPLPRRNMLLSKIIGRFKMQSAKLINEFQGSQGQPFWQRNYYDHIIRDEDDLNRIREYILQNPLKWDLDKDNLENLLYRRDSYP